MRPHQGRDRHVDAIDLTLSSPEPEVRPQATVNRHLQHPLPPGTIKQDPGNSYRSAHNDSRRQCPSTAGNVPPQQPRRINPHHVKQIIDTSSSKALRHVVIQLCKSSPALSGAIARGLAPYSPWAQALIRGQQGQPHPQRQPQQHQQSRSQFKPRSEPMSSEQDAYARARKRLGSSNTAQSSSSRAPMQDSITKPHVHRTTAVHGNSDGLRLPPSSQKPPAVKREPEPILTDSDDSNNIVDFPAMKHEAPRQEYRHHTTTGNSSRTLTSASIGAEGLTVRQRPTPHDASDHKPKVCLQCGELIKDDDMNCYYHHGSEGPAMPGDVPQYTCCGRFIGEPGCSFGRHVSARTGSMTNSKRPSPSPYGESQWSKKPRVL